MSETRSAIREMLIAGGLLLGFALAGVGLVALTYDKTAERIEDNRRMAIVQQLQSVLPPEHYDNDPARDMLSVTDAALLGSTHPLPVYRARLDGEPSAAILTVVAPDGYSGAIVLLVGILVDGSVSGVRVVRHQETPGLGDAIETTRSNWILGFTGRSLEDPDREAWKVGRDDGEFMHLSGATITSRATVKAVRNALLYFEEHQEDLFKTVEQPSQALETEQADSTDTDADTDASAEEADENDGQA